MRKKRETVKKGAAMLLAALLVMPTQPVIAAPGDALETVQEETEEKMESEEAMLDAAEETELDAAEEMESDAAEETESDAAEATESDDEETIEADAEEEMESDAEEETEPDAAEEIESDTAEETESDAAEEAESDAAEESDASDCETPVKTEEADASETEEAEEEPADPELEEEVEFFADDLATPSEAAPRETIAYNTGNQEIVVASQEDYETDGIGDVCFEEDGSYTIEIPEENPFFPYEVQFTWEDEVENRWFMDPEDSVEIDGHTFYVEASFDQTAVTQLTLNVAGEIVTVYPEEKEFTDNGGVSMFSLLPLEWRSLTVDLTGFTPIELTQVAIASLFAGENELTDTDKIAWRLNTDNYEISFPGDRIDLSYGSFSWGGDTWEMIVGEADQLAASDIRYSVYVELTDATNWLIPTMYKQTAEGIRTELRVLNSEYEAWEYNTENGRYLSLDVLADELERDQQAYLALSLDTELFANASEERIRVYEGRYSLAEEAEAAADITDKVFCKDMAAVDAGYLVEQSNRAQWLTLVSYSSSGEVTGCLSIELDLLRYVDGISATLWTEDGQTRVSDGTNSKTVNGIRERIITLKYGYQTDDHYRLLLNYNKADSESNSQITGAFIGRYDTLEAAQAAGVVDLKESLFDSDQGYTADFSEGVDITVFTGVDGAEAQKVYFYRFIVQEGELNLSGNSVLNIYGIQDASGNTISSWIFDGDNDDYSDDSFITVMVKEGTDLRKLALVFDVVEGAKLYAAGSSTPEISGESFHDFSNGPLQYTVSAENKKNAKNYWVQIVPAQTGAGQLYINSLSDPDAETTERDGVIYSTREMFLDGRYDYQHDILLLNIGTDAIPGLSAELDSDEVELDSYWTLSGNHELRGFTGTASNDTWNQAKLRLLPKEGAADGREIHGTLTIKSQDTPLMVLTLTGVVGDPSITTTEIPAAVRYVHYGTMIQNSNKYDFNTVSYRLLSGKLPAGMVMKENGELYGVPTETGEFPITVQMENSYEAFQSSTAEFVMNVMENTNENVENATDEAYYLIERVPDITLRNTTDYTMTSVGVFGEWKNLYLDGRMLTEGVDYLAESGSTRLTIRSQTLKSDSTLGTHTLSAEFRETGSQSLKRAAQNYQVTSGRSTSSGGSSSSGSSSTAAVTGTLARDARKGYVSSQNGIITGTGAHYSHWEQDETGWRLIYADGSFAAGQTVQQADGTRVEQVLWEKVNGSYYAFGTDGYLASGWVYDYRLEQWYCVSAESGMRTGWYVEPQDNQTYYLNLADGALAHGWREIDGHWYYLNEVSAAPTWIFNSETNSWFYNVASTTRPWGALLRSGWTPDGYWVDENGVWNGQGK